jgi:hypothetical protein
MPQRREPIRVAVATTAIDTNYSRRLRVSRPPPPGPLLREHLRERRKARAEAPGPLSTFRSNLATRGGEHRCGVAYGAKLAVHLGRRLRKRLDDALHEDPHRQPRRDRPAHHAHLPRDGHRHGGDLRRPGPQRAVRARRRRSGLHRPAHRQRLVPRHREDHRRRAQGRRRRRASRLRLPRRERRLRAGVRRWRPHFHRPDAGGHPPDGQQDRSEEDHGRRRRADHSRLQRRRTVRPRYRGTRT